MIRGMRDMQEDINKRASKALHILSSNKVIMDEGALPDGTTIDEFAEEIARPDAIIVKRPGKELVITRKRNLFITKSRAYIMKPAEFLATEA